MDFGPWMVGSVVGRREAPLRKHGASRFVVSAREWQDGVRHRFDGWRAIAGKRGKTAVNLSRRKVQILLGTAAVILVASWASAQFSLKLYRTGNLRIVFLDTRHEYILPHMARCFENSLRAHMERFGFQPSEPVTILLQDFDDYGYAGATAVPTNYLSLGIEPYEYVYETSPTNERINWVMSHELLHIVAVDEAAGSDRFFRKLFVGKVAPTDEQPLSMLYSYLTVPRLYAPRWYHEGMAVFMETWMSGGYGRALGGYDEMIFRSMVDENAYFYDTVGLQSEGRTIDFQVGQLSYLYGTRFVSYLAYLYGPDKIIQWVKRDPGSKASYRAQFRDVYGMDLDTAWRQWIEWEHTWQEANLKRVREYPLTTFKLLSKRPLGSVSRAYFDPDTRTLYTAVNYPGEYAQIVGIGIDGWKMRKIVEIPTPALYYVTSLAYDPASKTIFYTTDNSRGWRDLNAVDVRSGKATKLLKDIRVGDLVFDRADRNLWGVRHHNGISTLVRISPPYRDWDDITDVWTLPYGKDLFDIDISPNGTHLTGTLIEVTGRRRLINIAIEKLLAGSEEFDVLHEFPDNSPSNFVYSPDGRYLFGTSYFTGVSNIFRFDIERRKMDAVTNAATGFFRPLPISDDELIAFHYTAKGFEPALLPNVHRLEDINAILFLGQAIVEKYPQLKDWTLSPPSTIDLESLQPKIVDYKAIKDMRLTSVYPVLESYKNKAALGARADFMDPVGVARLSLTGAYTPSSDLPEEERVHLDGRFQRFPWEVTATLNHADFYDFFGPTKMARRGYSLGIKYTGIILVDRPGSLEYTARVAGYGGLDTLPDYQNIPTSIPSYFAAGFMMKDHYYRKTIGGLQPEKGHDWELGFSDQYAEEKNYIRLWGDAAVGIPLPIEHSSLWLRGSAGRSFGDRNSVFGNFYFGGFGNNWVDHGEVHRYRDIQSFPGLEINELPANDFGKLLVEWRLPPIRFRRLGVPNLYATWASFNVFATGIVVDPDHPDSRRTVGNVGVQLNIKLVIFTNLSTTLSIGYAEALEDGRRPASEFMMSLKIL